MKLEEAIRNLKKDRHSEDVEECGMIFVQSLDIAIQALEKDDVLGKIRAEIAEYKDDKIIHYERNEMIDIVLGIIDKYMERSEE